MIPVPVGVKIWRQATRRREEGFASLALQVQQVPRRNGVGGHIFCFR